MSMLYNILNFI